MSAHAVLSVRGLVKSFPRERQQRKVGVSAGGLASFKVFLGRAWRPRFREETAADGGNDIRALDSVSFDLQPGEVLGIIGRNGAGKSTLLKILARVLEPTAGRVTVHGRIVSLLDLGIGFAPELTVRENIHVYGRLAGFTPRGIAAAEDAILDFARLHDFRDVPLAACPSASHLQLAFASMVSLDANILLADEVLAVGDSEFRHRCEERIRAVRETPNAVLFVSHDMNAIRRTCSRVIWLDRGRIVQIGPTEAVVSAYVSELLAGHLLPPANGARAAICRILDLRLLDPAREPVGALQITEGGFIDCLFLVEQPDTAVDLEVELRRGRKYVLGSTAELRLGRGQRGTFRAGVRIPGDFLNEGGYRVRCRLSATCHSGSFQGTTIIAEEQLDFTVMNPHPERSVWADWSWGRAGVISPRLSWTVTPIT